ncbi:MAG: PAS domain-containing protein [Marivivens sp.]|nr:PAS domain-containing protein [Marivivens sp.]
MDERLRLRRFSEAARFFIKVRPVDIGRPLQEIATAINDHHLVNDLSSVLDGEQAAHCIVEKKEQLFERLIMKLSTARDAKISLAIIHLKLSGGEAAELELKTMRGKQLDILERNQDLLRAPDIETALRWSLEFLQSSLNADKVAYFSLDQSGGYLTLTAGFGWSRGIVGNTRLTLDEGGELYRALLSDELVAIEDLNAEPSSEVSVFARDAGVLRCCAKRVSYSSNSDDIIAVYYKSPLAIDETTLHLIEATANLI